MTNLSATSCIDFIDEQMHVTNGHFDSLNYNNQRDKQDLCYLINEKNHIKCIYDNLMLGDE